MSIGILAMRRNQKNKNSILRHYNETLFPYDEMEKQRIPAWRYIIREIVIPIAIGIIVGFSPWTSPNADIIVAALGVLGGLLFAHAIFVFELRMTYITSMKEKIKTGMLSGENKNLTRLIDELFYSVVYSSALALGVTIAVSLGSYLNVYSHLNPVCERVINAIIIILIVHLSMCIYRVLRTTASAYKELCKERIA